MPHPRVDDAAMNFAQSREWSRRQAARAWELRTAKLICLNATWRPLVIISATLKPPEGAEPR
jgi:hypothetical protein